VKLIQLKGGKAGITGREIGRLKKAADTAKVSWALAAYDGETLQLVPEDAGEASNTTSEAIDGIRDVEGTRSQIFVGGVRKK
jgi:hypothetical protein